MKTKGMITIDGYELQYRIEGEGTPVLVIGSAVYYPRLFSESIRKKLKLIFIDHRGFARRLRDVKPEDGSLDTVIDDIETIRSALELDNFVVLGHSGHAFLALEYAIRYPERVQKLVLLNAAPTNDGERQRLSIAHFEETASPERKSQFEADFAQLPGDLEKEPERRFAHVCIRMGAHSFYDYSFDSAYLWEGVNPNMPIIDRLWGEVFGQMNMLRLLPLTRKPVFLGLGKYDYMVAPVSLWDKVTGDCPNVTKIVFEHSGHNPMMEQPQLFDDTLTAWLSNDGRTIR